MTKMSLIRFYKLAKDTKCIKCDTKIITNIAVLTKKALFYIYLFFDGSAFTGLRGVKNHLFQMRSYLLTLYLQDLLP